MASSSGRVAQGEVIVDFADGGSYIKSKLEEGVLHLEKRRLESEESQKAQKAFDALEVSESKGVKAEDVDVIVSQLGCTKSEAETALREEKGDVTKAAMRLVRA